MRSLTFIESVSGGGGGSYLLFNTVRIRRNNVGRTMSMQCHWVILALANAV